jgi:hypothetical protein
MLVGVTIIQWSTVVMTERDKFSADRSISDRNHVASGCPGSTVASGFSGSTSLVFLVLIPVLTPVLILFIPDQSLLKSNKTADFLSYIFLPSGIVHPF